MYEGGGNEMKPSERQIKKVLNYLREAYKVKPEDTFYYIQDCVEHDGRKCRHCSSTMRMFCKSKPCNCSGPHNW